MSDIKKNKQRYYFIDKRIYFQNKKMPDRKVELFNIEIDGEYVYATDIDYNTYCIEKSDLIIEEE